MSKLSTVFNEWINTGNHSSRGLSKLLLEAYHSQYLTFTCFLSPPYSFYFLLNILLFEDDLFNNKEERRFFFFFSLKCTWSESSEANSWEERFRKYTNILLPLHTRGARDKGREGQRERHSVRFWWGVQSGEIPQEVLF